MTKKELSGILTELDSVRLEMWKTFCVVAKTDEDETEIGEYLDLMDKHQELLSKAAKQLG